MKKIFVILFLIIFITGCTSILGPGESVTASGIIKNLEVSSWMYGTHVLEDENGRTLYALKSSNLDMDYYINKEVKISGVRVKGYPIGEGPVYVDVNFIEAKRFYLKQ